MRETPTLSAQEKHPALFLPFLFCSPGQVHGPGNLSLQTETRDARHFEVEGILLIPSPFGALKRDKKF